MRVGAPVRPNMLNTPKSASVRFMLPCDSIITWSHGHAQTERDSSYTDVSPPTRRNISLVPVLQNNAPKHASSVPITTFSDKPISCLLYGSNLRDLTHVGIFSAPHQAIYHQQRRENFCRPGQTSVLPLHAIRSLISLRLQWWLFVWILWTV